MAENKPQNFSVFTGGGEQTVDIALNFIVKKNKYGRTIFRILTDEDVEKIKNDENDSTQIHTINTVWSLLGWKQQNEFLESSMEVNKVTGVRDINMTKYRDVVFKKCLKDWDLSEKNHKVPVTETAIDNLDPTIGNALLNKYDEMMSFDEAASGN